MTIPEIAEEYHCDFSALYRKFKKHKSELEGHYKKVGRKFILDDYAVDFLLPSKAKISDLSDMLERAQRENDEYGHMKFDEREFKAKIHSLTEEIIDIERKYNREKVKVEEAEKSIKSLKEKNALFEKQLTEQNEKIAELENQLLLKNENKKNGFLSIFKK